MTTKSSSPTVRALDELKVIHKRECESLHSDDIGRIDGVIGNAERESQKDALKQIIQFVKDSGLPFEFSSKDICKLRDEYPYGKLKINLEFVPSKVKSLSAVSTERNKFVKERNDASARLDKWYRDSLYRIASRESIEKFSVVKKP
jgi:hypothetical protein